MPRATYLCAEIWRKRHENDEKETKYLTLLGENVVKYK
jgi:hypothetical protein